MQIRSKLAAQGLFGAQRFRHLRHLRHLVIGLALVALPAAANDVDYRQHVMAAVGGHMQASAEILRQRVPHQAHAGLHAESLANLAAIAGSLFPAGSEGGDTLPATWQRPDDFAAKLQDFEEAAAGFSAAVAAEDRVGPAFQQLGQSCKNCHDDYRAK